MPDARGVGRSFEDQAARFLLGLGYTLITRRYACRHGELDLVAMDGRTLVFVEVKASMTNLPPEMNLTGVKADRLRRAAAEYVHAFGLDESPMRFDVVAIAKGDIRHYRGVFEALPPVTSTSPTPVEDEADEYTLGP